MISLLLIIAAFAGIFVLTKSVDESFKEAMDSATEKGTGDGSETETGGGASDTDTSGESNSDFYINTSTQTGYRTVAGVTYFFKVISAAKQSDGSYRYVVVYPSHFHSYSGYELCVAWSDDSITFGNRANSDSAFSYAVINEVGYLSYTAISNCANPDYVLEELNQNVFFDEDMFSYSIADAAG